MNQDELHAAASAPLPEIPGGRDLIKVAFIVTAGLIVVAMIIGYAITRINPSSVIDQPLAISACQAETVDVESSQPLRFVEVAVESESGEIVFVEEPDINGPYTPLDTTNCLPVDPDIITLEQLAREGIHVAGQVCNDYETAYSVTVKWIPVDPLLQDTGDDLIVLNTPITWPEGCLLPYDVTWVPNERVIEWMQTQIERRGPSRWRVVGTATPIDIGEVPTYTWDSVKTFTVTTEGIDTP